MTAVRVAFWSAALAPATLVINEFAAAALSTSTVVVATTLPAVSTVLVFASAAVRAAAVSYMALTTAVEIPVCNALLWAVVREEKVIPSMV